MHHFFVDRQPVKLVSYRLERQDERDRMLAQIDNGDSHQLHGEGEGALSAFVNAWITHSGQKINVVDYSEHAIGAGTNAEAIAYVQLNIDGQRMSGAAMDHDTVSASLKAVLSALSRSQATRHVADTPALAVA